MAFSEVKDLRLHCCFHPYQLRLSGYFFLVTSNQEAIVLLALSLASKVTGLLSQISCCCFSFLGQASKSNDFSPHLSRLVA